MNQPKSVRAIIINQDRLLVMYRNKFGDEYYTLIGGSVEPNESLEMALMREVREETGLQLHSCKLTFIEKPNKPFNEQYIYLCDYSGGEVYLPSNSIEAKLSKLGNIYKPQWMSLSELKHQPFVSSKLKYAILDAVQNGFPSQPKEILWGTTEDNNDPKT